MTEDEFWALIADTRAGAADVPRDLRPGEQNRRYRARLAAMTPEELVDFKRAFEQRMAEAYTWDLWAAAYVICQGCSNDGFRDFRAWLIAQGREAFEAAVRDPQTLADDPALGSGEYPSYSAFWSIPWQAYHDKTGADDFPELGLPPLGEPRGEKFDGDDEEALRARCPRLFAKFWEGE